MWKHRRSALSKNMAVIVAVLVVIIVIGVVVVVIHTTSRPPASVVSSSTPTSTTSSSLTTSSTTSIPFVLQPPNRSVLVDDSQISPPDALDPATGFTVPDEPVFFNVFQTLVEFNGSSITQLVPVVASNYSIVDNYKSYIFTIRPNVWFSNGDRVSAATVWFSLVREVFLGQSVGLSNYLELTVNATEYSQTGYAFPWGIRHAIQAVTGLPAVDNATLAAQVLANMLSNFNPANSTQLEIMQYPNQAYVVVSPYVFRMNLLESYRYMLYDLAGWWGDVVDPTYVDAHGGVQPNTPNSYFSANSGPGTGPYMVRSVGPAFSQVVLVANPDYWGKNVSGLAPVAQPPHIPVVIVNYGLTHNQRVEAFATNSAQISYVSIPFLQQMYSSYQYAKYYSFSQIFYNVSYQPALWYISMNTQIYPTNITDFRLAIEHAIDYTQILNSLFYYDGAYYGQLQLGPITPQFPEFYNPDNLPMYSYNVSLAEYYLNLSGYQGKFYVLTPNGTILGDQSGRQLGTLTITYITPIEPFTQSELTIVVEDLETLAPPVTLPRATPSASLAWTTPQATPNFVYNFWEPDWADPIFQLMYPAVTTSSLLPAWMNLTVVNNIMETLPFLTNITQQRQLVAQVYNITYNYAPYVWLPNPDTYFFVQPYLKGFVYTAFSYYYMTAYYTNTT
ncbi:MAG: ABC transporter substrate-binding protein [Thermoprotei archaeon]